MERIAKTKVVASVCGADFVQFLAALAVLPRSIWKIMMNSTVSSKPAEANLPNFFIISSFLLAMLVQRAKQKLVHISLLS